MKQENSNPNFDFYSFNAQNTTEKQTSAPESTPPAEIDQDLSSVSARESLPESDTGEAMQAELPASPPVDLSGARRSLKSTYSFLGIAFFVVNFVWLVVANVLSLAVDPALASQTWFSMIVGTLPLYVLCTPLLYLMIKHLPKAPLEKKKLNFWPFALLFVFAQTLMVGGSLIGNGLMSVLGTLTGWDFSNALNDTFDLPLYLSFLFTVILAPVFEELIFRKLLLDRMLPHGEVCAIVVNGLLFGAFHGNFYQFFYASLLGMLLAYIYTRTGKIHYSILMHMIVNFVGGILPTVLMDWLDYDTFITLTEEAAILEHISAHPLAYFAMSAYSTAQYGLAITGLILMIMFRKKFLIRKSRDQLSAKAGIGAAFCNAGIITALVFCGLLFALSLLSAAPVLQA